MLTRIRGVELGDFPLMDPPTHPEECHNQDPWGPNDGLHQAHSPKPDEALVRRVGRGEKGPLRSKSSGCSGGITPISTSIKEQISKIRLYRNDTEMILRSVKNTEHQHNVSNTTAFSPPSSLSLTSAIHLTPSQLNHSGHYAPNHQCRKPASNPPC